MSCACKGMAGRHVHVRGWRHISNMPASVNVFECLLGMSFSTVAAGVVHVCIGSLCGGLAVCYFTEDV